MMLPTIEVDHARKLRILQRDPLSLPGKGARGFAEVYYIPGSRVIIDHFAPLINRTKEDENCHY